MRMLTIFSHQSQFFCITIEMLKFILNLNFVQEMQWNNGRRTKLWKNLKECFFSIFLSFREKSQVRKVIESTYPSSTKKVHNTCGERLHSVGGIVNTPLKRGNVQNVLNTLRWIQNEGESRYALDTNRILATNRLLCKMKNVTIE